MANDWIARATLTAKMHLHANAVSVKAKEERIRRHGVLDPVAADIDLAKFVPAKVEERLGEDEEEHAA